MRKMKCPECYDYRFIHDKVIIAICASCLVTMILERGDLSNE